MEQEITSTHSIGIVGALGDMGNLYARRFAAGGWTVHVCDLPLRFEELQLAYQDEPKCIPWSDGLDVVRRADFILYSVETENIPKVVERLGPATKVGAIVGGQTSVKEPEIRAFETYLPPDVDIVTCHSLHGPQVDPKGQPLVIIRHRASDDAYHRAKSILSCLGSDLVELNWQEHDRITADTQAVTHVAFMSMGTAWMNQGVYPWLNDTYVGGIENVKVMTAFRIFGNKWHVYAGLAIMNPCARDQVLQYAKSAAELLQLVVTEQTDEFRSRIKKAAEYVFGTKPRQPALLSDDWLDQYSLSSIPKSLRKPNSHLSLLAIVDCWYHSKINPYDHMICQTPPFRLWLGITEYLFLTPDLLESAMTTALQDRSIRGDDLAFVLATATWSRTVALGSMSGYQKLFEQTSTFFDRSGVDVNHVKQLSAGIIGRVTEKWMQARERQQLSP